jgi:hypothetical protein
VPGGVCLAFVRFLRDAATYKVSLSQLVDACVLATPLRVLATLVVFIYRPKTLRRSLRMALLAPSIVISMVAPSIAPTKPGGGTTGVAGGNANRTSVRSVYEAPLWSGALGAQDWSASLLDGGNSRTCFTGPSSPR